MPDEIPHDAQITPAHVLEYMQQEVTPRLDTLEGKVDRLETIVQSSGLNGHTPLLKAFLEQYGNTYVKRQAWLTVRSDIIHRLRWIAVPEGWLKMLAAAVIGGVGWRLASSLPIHELFFH